MSQGGTAMYARLPDGHVPPLVARAVAAANDLGFELSVHPATGRLLQSLAGGVQPGGLIGETGTGTGVGLAWMASSAHPGVRLLSIEIDADRAAAAQTVFVDTPNVTVLCGDARELYEHGPFHLLVFDGGWGSAKAGDAPVGVAEVLVDGGLLTVDDFSPMTTWPPRFHGELDRGRHYWLTHPEMLATEIAVAPDMAVVIARRTAGLQN
ncbi:MAG: SAM-dependent methyltransferase [Acidimicrobiales bacterium]|nr:SAM-dependent methyltransferase [Acidimicrobiales bacterium]